MPELTPARVGIATLTLGLLGGLGLATLVMMGVCLP